MARESTITYEQLAAVADSIKARGEKPTSRNVREALGTGSMATVLKLLQQWQGGQMRAEDTPVVLPPALQRALVDFIGQEVSCAKSALQADLVDAQQSNADLIIENERQFSTIELQAEALELAQVEKAGLAGRLAQVESDLAKSNDDVAAERQAAEAARVELAKAELRLETVPRIEAEIEKVRAELLEARTKAAELHEVAAVAAAQLEASTTARIKVEQQLEAANEAASKARAKAEQQLEAAATREATIAKALENERVAVQACQARLESAARELAAANEAASKARAEAKKAGEEAAELRGQLAREKKPAKPVKGE